LLLHVLIHDLSLRPGCRAQIVLGQLSQEMAQAATAEIAILDDCIEQCKAQSPAHTMALKQRMAPGADGGSAGLKSAAYGRPTAGKKPNSTEPPAATPSVREPVASDYQTESKPLVITRDR
jgi:hypothetical protein